MNKFVSGIIWATLDKVSLQVINFLIFVILARLLTPTVFGLVALSAVFVAFIQLFIDQGMAQAIIQFDTLTDEHLDSAFWVGVSMGGIFALFGALFSGPIALLFNEPALQPVVTWLSLGFIFSAFSSTQQALLQRNLEFKKLALRSIVAKTASGLIGVLLAVFGAGVWSLVVQTLVYSLAEVIMLWSVSSWRPKFRFSFSHAKRLLKFGGNTMGVRLVDFFDFRFDDFLVGYFLGATALGYYSISFRLLRLLSDFLGSIPGSVLFPSLSRLQNDVVEFKRTFIATVKYANVLIWPIFLGSFVLAEEIIVSFFGAQWLPSVPVFKLLALGGILICSLQFNGYVVWAMGRPDYIFRLRLVITIIRVIAYLVAVQFGIIYVGLAYFLVNLFVFSPLYTNILRKFANFTSLGEISGLYSRPAAASVGMALVLFFARTAMQGISLGQPLKLAVLVLTGMGCYAAVILLMWPTLFYQAKGFIMNLYTRA